MKVTWTYQKLGDVAEITAGQSAPQGDDDYCDNGTPFIKAGNLEDLSNGMSEMDMQKVSEEIAEAYRLKKYKAGAVLFAKSGMSCMKGLVYALKNDCYVVNHLAIVTPTNINSDFLKYYLQYNKPNSLVRNSGYPSLTLNEIKNLLIPIPEEAIQLQIVTELDLLCNLIEMQKTQIKELENLAQSIFYQMFGNLSANDKRWDMKEIHEISKVITGNTPSRKNTSYYDNKHIEWIKTDNIERGKLHPSPAKEFLSEEGAKKGRVADIGSILIACIAGSLTSIGKCCILDRKVSFNQQINAIIPKKELNSLYAYYLFGAMSDEIRRYASNGMKHILNKSVLETIKIPCPPLALQKEYASKAESIEQMKSIIRKSLKNTEVLYNSRLHYYFDER